MALVFWLLSGLTFGVLAGPLTGGICLMTLRAYYHPQKRVNFADLFSGFDQFGPLVGVFFLTLAAYALGTMLFVFPAILLMTVWLFAEYLIVDRNHGVMQSLSASYRIVCRKDFAANLLLVIIAVALMLLPALLGIGPLILFGLLLGCLTTPLAWLLTMSAYVQQVREDTGELDDVLNDAVAGRSPAIGRPAAAPQTPAPCRSWAQRGLKGSGRMPLPRPKRPPLRRLLLQLPPLYRYAVPNACVVSRSLWRSRPNRPRRN